MIRHLLEYIKASSVSNGLNWAVLQVAAFVQGTEWADLSEFLSQVTRAAETMRKTQQERQ